MQQKQNPDDPRLDVARENLRMLAAKRRLNYSEVARKAGLSRNAVQQFVAGKTSLTYHNMLKVSDVLEVNIGIIHRPDAVTLARLDLYKFLDSMPDHLIPELLDKLKSS